jgi:hypothetical protein
MKDSALTATAAAKTDDMNEITLDSRGLIRKIHGEWILWQEDSYREMGVIRTKGGSLVYWSYTFGCVEPDTTFRVFDDLEELDDAELLEDDDLAEVAAALGQQIVRELDI